MRRWCFTASCYGQAEGRAAALLPSGCCSPTQVAILQISCFLVIMRIWPRPDQSGIVHLLLLSWATIGGAAVILSASLCLLQSVVLDCGKRLYLPDLLGH